MSSLVWLTILGLLVICIADVTEAKPEKRDEESKSEENEEEESAGDRLNRLMDKMERKMEGEDYREMMPDDRVYLFAYGYSFGVYEHVSEDGELRGLGYNIVRAVCRMMKKKCEHAVYYDYSLMWDASSKSDALNQGWYDVGVSWVPNAKRESAYGFFGTYADEPETLMFVSITNTMDSVEEVKESATKFGFRTGFGSNDKCLQKYLGTSLEGKATFYADSVAMEQALIDGEVEVIFMAKNDVTQPDKVEQVGDEPIRCSEGGVSMMVRKDKLHHFGWFEVGFKKLRDMGDYNWLCGLSERDPGCFHKND